LGFLALLMSGCQFTGKPCNVKPAPVFCPAFELASSKLSDADKAALINSPEWPRPSVVSPVGRAYLEFGEPVDSFFDSCGVSHFEMKDVPFTEGLAQYLRGQDVDMHNICARYKSLMIPPPPPP